MEWYFSDNSAMLKEFDIIFWLIQCGQMATYFAIHVSRKKTITKTRSCFRSHIIWIYIATKIT